MAIPMPTQEEIAAMKSDPLKESGSPALAQQPDAPETGNRTAKNPNPAGHISTEASSSTEASGPVGLGPTKVMDRADSALAGALSAVGDALWSEYENTPEHRLAMRAVRMLTLTRLKAPDDLIQTERGLLGLSLAEIVNKPPSQNSLPPDWVVRGVAASLCDVIEAPEVFSKSALKNLAARMRRALASKPGELAKEGHEIGSAPKFATTVEEVAAEEERQAREAGQ